MCAVEHSTLSYPTKQELCDRRAEDRANALTETGTFEKKENVRCTPNITSKTDLERRKVDDGPGALEIRLYICLYDCDMVTVCLVIC